MSREMYAPIIVKKEKPRRARGTPLNRNSAIYAALVTGFAFVFVGTIVSKLMKYKLLPEPVDEYGDGGATKAFWKDITLSSVRGLLHQRQEERAKAAERTVE